jgi:hypothetical protein
MNLFVVFLSHYRTYFKRLLVNPFTYYLFVRTRSVNFWTEKADSRSEDWLLTLLTTQARRLIKETFQFWGYK